MKDFVVLSCILVLAVAGLTFTCHVSAMNSDETPTLLLLPEVSEVVE